MRKPLTLHDAYEYNGYFISMQDGIPYVENWYMAAKKGSVVISELWEEILHLNTFDTFEDYIETYKEDIHGAHGLPYLIMHACFLRVLRKKPQLVSKMLLLDACKGEGPLKLQADSDWGFSKAVLNLLMNEYPYIKLRSVDRLYIERFLTIVFLVLCCIIIQVLYYINV